VITASTSLRLLGLLTLAVMALSGAGCATTRVDDPALAVTLSVTGLRDDERELLRAQVCALEGVKECALVDVAPPAPPAVEKAAPASKKKRGKRSKRKKAAPPGELTITMGDDVALAPVKTPTAEARVVFTYRGSLGELRHQIASLPHPGLEARSAEVTLTYRGFDNLAPKVRLLEPDDGTLIAEKKIIVTAEIPDIDLASIDIDGDVVLASPPGTYSREAELDEGENLLVVSATDRAGNRTEASVTVVVDTTPPAMEVEVLILPDDKVLVKGNVKDATTVTINGKPVDIDMFGRFERQVATDPDTTNVEVEAKDALGNAVKIIRTTLAASGMSAS
jgi:hypothetical protein